MGPVEKLEAALEAARAAWGAELRQGARMVPGLLREIPGLVVHAEKVEVLLRKCRTFGLTSKIWGPSGTHTAPLFTLTALSAVCECTARAAIWGWRRPVLRDPMWVAASCFWCPYTTRRSFW